MSGKVDHHLYTIISDGIYHGQIVYIHYTNLKGWEGITKERKIRKSRFFDMNGNSCYGVSLSLAKDVMNASTAQKLIFCNKTADIGKSSFVFVFYFSLTPVLNHRAPGNKIKIHEIVFENDVSFDEIVIVYDGVNPF